MARGISSPGSKSSASSISLENLSEGKNSDSQKSSMNSLRSSLSLSLSSLPAAQMAIPIYVSPSRQDVEVGGRLLFQNFIYEELENVGLPQDAIEVENPPPGAFGDDITSDIQAQGDSSHSSRAASPAFIGTPEGYTNSNFITLGANIREIADQFAASHQRAQIRNQADQVDLGHINYNTFHNLLSELFKNGMDKYCIVALFYFCSDILIRCVKNELHRLGSRLFFWALEFLVRHVCSWVYDHGGWERVFSNIYNIAMKVAGAAALCVFIACGIVYVKKNWNS